MKIIDLPISQEMKKTLTDIGYVDATPIQEKAIPLALNGTDIIGQAQTGTGKTAGFSIPIIEQMADNVPLQTLILVPTRELALQVTESFRQMATHRKIRVATVFGGASIEKQIKELRSGFEVVVATPGRCIDLMRRRVLKAQNIRFLVLDEVDEMLSMGFIDDIETIVEQIGSAHQTLFFSATMNKKIENIAQKFLTNPERVQIAPTRKNLDQIEQKYLILRDGQKTAILSDLLHVQNPEKAIIFARTKRRVDDVAEELTQQGFVVDRIHGDLSQEQRTFTFKKFRGGQTRILIATDVAARGLDIKELSHVYNYDLPQEIEYYVHRIGRTGRADASGQAISFFTPAESKKILPIIERQTKSKLIKITHPSKAEILAAIDQQAAERLIENLPNLTSAEHFNMAKKLLEDNNATELLASALMLLTPDFDQKAFEKRYDQTASQNRNRSNNDGGGRSNRRNGNSDGDRNRRRDRDGRGRDERGGNRNRRRDNQGGANANSSGYARRKNADGTQSGYRGRRHK